MQQTIQISTPAHNGLYDITKQVEAIVAESKVQTGLVNVYAQGATTGIMIQENWDDSVQNDGDINRCVRNCWIVNFSKQKMVDYSAVDGKLL